jgi:hypothetical protein
MVLIGLKCAIRWIDKHGNPTPDDSRAVALVSCDHGSGWNGGPIRVFPICEKHAKQMPPNWSVVEVKGLEEALVKLRGESYQKGRKDLSDEMLDLMKRLDMGGDV